MQGLAATVGCLPQEIALPVLRYDLHCHSTHSDGLLSPAALVQRAARRGVDVLALTDHDELSGLAEAQAEARETHLRLIPGAELSVSWREITLHVLALGIDAECPALCDGLAAIRSGRLDRARRIGDSLADAGIPGAYEGALQFVTSEARGGALGLRYNTDPCCRVTSIHPGPGAASAGATTHST